MEVGTLSNLTKNALAASLMKALSEKSIDRITIQELTDYCGLARNTFYYHFKDVYDLLSYIFTSEMETLRIKYTEERNWQGGLEYGLKYLYEHRLAIKNIQESGSLDLIIRYINRIAFEHATAIVEKISKEVEHHLDNSTRDFLARFYKDALLGSLLDWIATDMEDSPEDLADYFDAMFHGTFDSAITTAQRMHDNV